MALISPTHKTVLTWRRIELATDRLAILPGPLHERLAGLRFTLKVLSASDFPTSSLGTQWEAIWAALLHLDTEEAPLLEGRAVEIACDLLDLRAALRKWVTRGVESADGLQAFLEGSLLSTIAPQPDA